MKKLTKVEKLKQELKLAMEIEKRNSYSNPNDRMNAIMENIVENKGTFKP